jgi:hypothetical protein
MGLREARQLQVAARQRNVWLVGGISAFLVIVLAAAAVVVALALQKDDSVPSRLPGFAFVVWIDL